MYPVLILRSELICLVILVFLFFTSRTYNIDKGNRTFNRMLNFAIIHVIFDIITVLTVNNQDTVPAAVNDICHIFFYLSAIMYSCEIGHYIVELCYPTLAKPLYIGAHAVITIFICSLPFLKIEYVEAKGTYSSAGLTAYVGYGIAFSFFIVALILIFSHLDKMPAATKSALIPMMIVLMITEVSQVIWRSLLFTGGAITIVTVGMFFSLENPVAVFKKKAMTDALTGVRSRSSFEEDIEKYDRDFQKKPGSDYIFVFCDINDLRSVNNRFGHEEGDNYITLVASAINICMKKAAAVYRIGGDEFIILYFRVSATEVEEEIKLLQEICEESSKALKYKAGIAAGYAVSSDNYKSLSDVVKTADYAMYQNKARLKTAGRDENESLGTKLNYAGLTDRMFDVMCASNDKSYPFITNLDTNVTRIDPEWKNYFGLEDEFYGDFIGVWKDRIHPDYFDGYLADVIAVINGHKKYHNYDYLAKKADGEYVRVSCHGSVYQDVTSGIRYFSGYIDNHGLDENLDPVTGLKPFDKLITRVCSYMDSKIPFAVLKLQLKNFAHVNMLYGYSGGNSVIKRLAEVLIEEMGNKGTVFCQGSVNFTMLFDTCDESVVEEYYRKISEKCAAGLETAMGTVPIVISGGAITNNGENREIEQIRGGLVFALEESQFYQRNNLVFYRDFDNGESGNDISLLAKIHADALADMRCFKLRYQPIVNIESGKTVGCEALLRWIHPVYGEVLPGNFIEFIENDPCYYRLGLFILEQALRDSKKYCDEIPGYRINVNVTAIQLQSDGFADDVIALLRKYEFKPNSLVLELTERCKTMDSKFLAKKIALLRSRGILVAFDDLGTGYSTISLLMDIPVDEIKLDKDFVDDLGKRENYQLFVRTLAIGSSSHGNNYTICFEGVEDEQAYDVIKNFGNFLSQGFYFAKPLLIDEFNEYMKKQDK